MDSGSSAAILGVFLGLLFYGITTFSEMALRLASRNGLPSQAQNASLPQWTVKALQTSVSQTVRALVASRILFAAIVLSGLVAFLSPRDRVPWGVEAIVLVVTAVLLLLLPRALVRMIAGNPLRWVRATSPWLTLARAVGTPLAFLASSTYPAEAHVQPPSDPLMLQAGLLPEGSSANHTGAPQHNEQEREMIRSILELDTTSAREIMTPRVDLVAVSTDASLSELATAILEKGHSRIPIFEGTIDHIIGVVDARDYMRAVTGNDVVSSLRGLARQVLFVPESMKLNDLLLEFQQKRMQMAIVVDEYGGTAGIVTLEDLLEEIVGELSDEHSHTERPAQVTSTGEAMVLAREPLDKVNELFGTSLQSEDVDTVGGYVVGLLGKMPTIGDKVAADGLEIEVAELIGRRIRKVRIARREPDSPDSHPDSREETSAAQGKWES
ncbi:MAG: HlyC/CorC family transporter [Dehalococcoidia bacterium]|nr:HlyC/CorC family transporter [Dehalococcoidia bacterium]